MLDKIKVILVNPSHPGNIGAVARAMKNMGLNHLTLVAPKVFPHHEATARAAGADEILENAEIFNHLEEAVQNCHQAYALSARLRRLSWPNLTPTESAGKIIQQTESNYQIALVFGRENSGLTNAELAKCQYHITIPSHPDFPSLNLAQAVQIMAYEIWQQQIKTLKDVTVSDCSVIPVESENKLAPQAKMQGFFQHLEQTLLQLKILSPKHPKMLMQRLRRIFNRAELDEIELNILRGILTAINRLEQNKE